MKEEILINVTPQETRVAVMLHGIVQELQIERTSSVGFVGNIYKGKVTRVLPGMQSAFVEIGLARAAFLHIADMQESLAEKAVLIQSLLQEGQHVMVQVIKDPIGSKGARLTTQVSIAGCFLVFLPQQDRIVVSQRIDNSEDKEALKERLGRLLADYKDPGGYIIRTRAEVASDEELAADVHYLRSVWQNTQQAYQDAADFEVIYQDLTLPLRVLRDLIHANTSKVIVDSREAYQAMYDFAGLYVKGIQANIECYSSLRPLFELYMVEHEIEKALSNKVFLQSGGYLVFDQTEALTTVDVNTGGCVDGATPDEIIFKTNLEAASAIARQLRLRNLCGIIVIDFIDMRSDEHRELVLAELHKAMLPDRTRHAIYGFSELGLVEMTRKRTRESLARQLCEPCEVCNGRGQVKTVKTVCYEILRALVREARQYENVKGFRLLASQPVVDCFMEEDSQSLARLSDFIAKPVLLQVEKSYTQEIYDIVYL